MQNMKISRQNLIRISILYLFLALVTASVSFFSRKYDVRASTDLQVQIWKEYTDNTADAAETPGYSVVKANLTRIFIPGLMAFLRITLGVSWEQAFSLLRILAVLLFYLIFHFYLREWFDEKEVYVGTLFAAATVPLTFNLWIEIPTEFPEMIFFTLGMWAMYKEKFWALLGITFIATFNRETSAMLPLIYFFNSFYGNPLKMPVQTIVNKLVRVSLIGFAWLIPYILLRYLSGLRTEWNHGDSLSINIPGLMAFFQNYNLFNNYLFYLYLFGIFWIVPFLYWKKLPLFWKSTLLSVPFVLSVYLFGGGGLHEPREIVVLYPLLIPPGLAYFFDKKMGPENKDAMEQEYEPE